MANDRNRCCFQWDIYNPFLPWRNSEATFYHGSPTVTQWKVTLQPMDRRINYWKFLFSLEFDEWFDPRDEIVAGKVNVLIKLNGKLITLKEVRNYLFCRDNRCKYYFQNNVFMCPRMEPHHLFIKVEISLPGNDTRNEVRYGLFANRDDLKWLSRDLRKLLHNPEYSNMKLLPRNSHEHIPAHSYIIDARWNNFFCLHAFKAGTWVTVETNISKGLLKDILTYMYSGTLGINWPDWKDAAYITELFQVIDRYKLYHLYKVFVRNDLQQVRVTRTPVLIESRLFPLDVVNGRLMTNASQTWHVNPNSEYEFIFQIRVGKGMRGGPWLSHSLKSKSPSRVHAKVYLEVIKKREGKAFGRPLPFYERDCTIDPDATVESRCVLYLGCPETFGDLNSTSSDRTEIKYFIQCFFNVINGTTLSQVRSISGDTLQNDLVRFGVLSNHMYNLNKRKLDADMQILIPPSSPVAKDEHKYPIHKGIFATRVPMLWEGLENVPQGSDIPDIARSTLSRETLPIVFDYMYTGKLFTIPFLFLNEIEYFAEQTMFYSLQDIVSRIRARWIDR
ncbi:hypothetical protein AVEN_200316-1 [Araneus ventricosus]|uniref:BTB domain-containing protein n=1 Tax=Araneus ventricosus TaxID=182803 RepID=A0A4Y2M458_ARAVE|nr:hypothetical protein AVEN_200316-1 [Araneus ventricosus]